MDEDIQFEWDDDKARLNVVNHGISFRKASLVFRSEILEFIDDREDYGEVRYVCMGRIDAQVYNVVYTRPVDMRIRLISAWRASLEDEEHYLSQIFPFRTRADV